MALIYLFIILFALLTGMLFLDAFLEMHKSSRAELIHFSRTLSRYLEMGVPLSAAFQHLQNEQTGFSFKLRKAIIRTGHGVKSGLSLSKALSKSKHIFPKYFIKVIEMGEQTETLPDALKQLARYNEARFDIRRAFLNCLIYPILTLVPLIFTIYMAVNFTLPEINNVYQKMNLQLPLITELFLYIEDLAEAHLPFIIAVLVTAAVILSAFPHNIKTLLDWLRLKVPGLQSLEKLYEYTVFARTLQLMIQREKSLDLALEFTADNMTNTCMSQTIKNIALSQEPMLSERLKQSDVFSPSFVWMVSLGEKTGEMSSALDQLAEYYSIELDRKLKDLKCIMEICLTFIIGIFVSFTVFSFLLPASLLACKIAEQITAY